MCMETSWVEQFPLLCKAWRAWPLCKFHLDTWAAFAWIGLLFCCFCFYCRLINMLMPHTKHVLISTMPQPITLLFNWFLLFHDIAMVILRNLSSNNLQGAIPIELSRIGNLDTLWVWIICYLFVPTSLNLY